MQVEYVTRFAKEAVANFIADLSDGLTRSRRGEKTPAYEGLEAQRSLSFMAMHGVPEARRELEKLGLD